MKYLYGDSWERFPIEDNEIWIEQKGSKVKVHDIFNPLPEFFKNIDMIYTDTPWNTGNLKTFYTKAELQCPSDFNAFSNRVSQIIKEIFPKVCYLEIGKQNFEVYKKILEVIYPVVQSWDIVYYRKNPMKLLRGGSDCQRFDFTGMDDEKTPMAAIENEDIMTVADICMGRGGTAVAAFKTDKIFFGTELNKRRLAVTIDKIAKLGGSWNIAKDRR